MRSPGIFRFLLCYFSTSRRFQAPSYISIQTKICSWMSWTLLYFLDWTLPLFASCSPHSRWIESKLRFVLPLKWSSQKSLKSGNSGSELPHRQGTTPHPVCALLAVPVPQKLRKSHPEGALRMGKSNPSAAFRDLKHKFNSIFLPNTTFNCRELRRLPICQQSVNIHTNTLRTLTK